MTYDFIEVSRSSDLLIECRDGIWWYEATPPPRRHACYDQTRCWSGGEFIQRCACGSIRIDYGSWKDRLSRSEYRKRRHWFGAR
jgi:hypothetical protein